MADETTYTTLDDLRYSAIINTSVMDTLVANVVGPPHMRNESLAGQPSIAMDFPKWPSMTAASVAEATDLDNTAVSTSKSTVTAGENGIMTTLTDVARTSTIAGRPEELGRLFGESVARLIDSDLFALFSALNGATAIGTSGSNLTLAQFESAYYTLRSNNATPPYVFICHPVQAAVLRSAISSATGTIFGNVTPEELASKTLGYEYNLYGVDVYSSTQCPTANTAADRVGAIMSTGMNAPIALVTNKVVDTELQRDASLRATEVVTVADYGVGEIEDAAGVPVITDA